MPKLEPVTATLHRIQILQNAASALVRVGSRPAVSICSRAPPHIPQQRTKNALFEFYGLGPIANMTASGNLGIWSVANRY